MVRQVGRDSFCIPRPRPQDLSLAHTLQFGDQGKHCYLLEIEVVLEEDEKAHETRSGLLAAGAPDQPTQDSGRACSEFTFLP